MWTAIILTITFGLILMVLGIYGAICYVTEELSTPMRMDGFRYYKLNQVPDYFSVCGYPCYHYDNKPSKQDKEKYNDYVIKSKKTSRIKGGILICLPVVIFIIALLGFARLGAFFDNERLKKSVEEYKSAKHTIEQSLVSEKLTGLERIELLKQVREKNEWLARKKYEVSVWYNFHLDDKIVLELDFIDLEGER